jgi:nitrous oxidase accessory protein NosD
MAQAATIEAGPRETQTIRPIASLAASEIAPGTIIRLHAGHYSAPIIVPVSGTKARPIIIEGADDGPITIEGSMVLDHAAFVIVRHLHIAHATDAGIILREGSHDDIVSNNEISGARLGIWIGQNAGDANSIEGNVVTDSTTHGIALDGVRGAAGRETRIARNSIESSGIHGIEIRADHTIIEGNIVSDSGRLSTGASGIHIYARNAGEDLGRNNLIRGNTSFGNHDASAQDGNGIQLDQWCDDNLVIDNRVMQNDGAGISVFDAARASIIGNVIHANMRDPGHSHRHKGELVFASDDEHGVDHTIAAIARSNSILAEDRSVAAILVDAPTSRHPPDFGHNRIANSSGGPVARWASLDIDSLAAWNALAPHSAPDDAARPGPTFVYDVQIHPGWRALPAAVTHR